jgi:hypothetical protein
LNQYVNSVQDNPDLNYLLYSSTTLNFENNIYSDNFDYEIIDSGNFDSDSLDSNNVDYNNLDNDNHNGQPGLLLPFKTDSWEPFCRT